jgi:hypothetical protein
MNTSLKATYQCWCDMKNRCRNPIASQYKNYGGRGISVCVRWMTSFQNFVEDMGCKPCGMTIERKDNDGNYEPDNCRWATRAEQRANQRGNVMLPCGGSLLPLEVVAKKLGLHPTTLRGRVRRGWPLEQVVSPVNFEKQQKLRRELAAMSQQPGGAS